MYGSKVLMARKFDGELNVEVGLENRQIEVSQIFCQNIESVSKASCAETSIDVVDQLQGKCKIASSGLDCGVNQVLKYVLSSDTQEGPLPHGGRTTRSECWCKGNPRTK